MPPIPTGDILHDFRRHLRTRSENPRSQLEYMLTSETMDNIEADLLADLYNPAQPGFFSAYLHGRKHSDLRFEVKPRGVLPDLAPEEVVSSISIRRASRKASGTWAISRANGSRARPVRPGRPRGSRGKLRIETVIAKNDRFTATAEIHFRAVTNADRVIKFGLLPSLRVMRVSTGGRDVASCRKTADGWQFLRHHAAAHAARRRSGLTVEYQGDKVVYKAGGGNFSVGARESWYPSLNAFRDHSALRPDLQGSQRTIRW